jgi:uncharacterized Rmd1/YagE family protein
METQFKKVEGTHPVPYPWTRQQLHIPFEIDNHKYIEDFIAFHTANPRVYNHIMRELYRCRGLQKKTSMKEIINTLRYATDKEINKTGKYMINDAFTSLYGAVIYHNFPELRKTFTSKILNR